MKMSFNLCRIVSKDIKCFNVSYKRYFLGISNKQENEEDTESTNFVDDKIETPKINRNKSGLTTADWNRFHNRRPYNVAQSWVHLTEKYKRKMFGRYGFESNINPRICFPTKLDIEAKLRYDSVAESHTLIDMMNAAKEERERQRAKVLKRDEEINNKMKKLDQWKQDLQNKIDKKEAEVLAIKQRKERLIEEVRHHFGFKIDPRDERFKIVLEQKEKEEKKKMKEGKRQAKEQKLMSKLVSTTNQK
uniref:Large ribosomal subunit protein mL64 n=1 Tax=Glossina palpalis gambiensis TaxID=67801 RepID=A0A1B0AR99_9MUSC